MKRSRILFCVLPEKGHINPYVGPAQALVERGHAVWFIAPGDISVQLHRSGLHFDPALVPSSSSSQPMRGAELVRLVKDREAMRSWISSLLLNVTDEQVREYAHYYRDHDVDLIVVDPLFYAAVIAAEVMKKKWVSMSNSLNPILPPEMQSDLLDTLDSIQGERSKLFERYGIEAKFRGCDALSPYLTLAFASRAFVGEPPSDVKLVGPSLPIGRRGDADSDELLPPRRPLIYASFGSQIYYWPEIFEKLIEACDGLDVELALSIGDLSLNLKRLPNFVRLYEYAPQLELLRYARVFITHGGANSIMEAIAFDTPVLVSPMCNDQFHQAAFVEKCGVGIVRDLQTRSADDIRRDLKLLLDDGKIRDCMNVVSSTFRTDGARESAVLIEELL